MATHCRILAWRVPWTEEPGGLQSTGSQRVRHNWGDNTHAHSTVLYSVCINLHSHQHCTAQEGSTSSTHSPAFIACRFSMMAFLTSVTWHSLSSELHFSNEWGASQVVLVVKNPPANAGNLRDLGLIPGLGRSPGEGHGNPLQCSCLESPMDRGAWQTTVHGVAKSQTWLKKVEHLFICLLAIYISSLEKCLFRSLILNFLKRNLAFQLELIKI